MQVLVDKEVQMVTKVEVRILQEEEEEIEIVHDIYYTPKLKYNLLSLGQLMEKLQANF